MLPPRLVESPLQPLSNHHLQPTNNLNATPTQAFSPNFFTPAITAAVLRLCAQLGESNMLMPEDGEEEVGRGGAQHVDVTGAGKCTVDTPL